MSSENNVPALDPQKTPANISPRGMNISSGIEQDASDHLAHKAPRNKPNIDGIVIFGLLVVSVFVAGAFTWGVSAPLTSSAVASGTITVDSNVKTIQHLEGGIIQNIFVKEGSSVNAGDPLISLNDAQTRASWVMVTGRYHNLRALEARLIAERDGAGEISFFNEVGEQEFSTQLDQVQKSQLSIFGVRRESLRLREEILQDKILQLGHQINSFKAQVKSADDQINIISQEVGIVKKMVAKGIERVPRLLKLQREQASLEGRRDEYRGRISETGQKIGETKLQILNIHTEHQKEVVVELREVQTQLDDIRESREATRDILERSIMLAPVDGIIENQKFFTAGGVIGPGEPIFDIVPRNDKLIVEAKVKPIDIDVVYVGLPAKLTLSALKQRTTPQLNGNVIYVSANSDDDPRTGESYYKVRISISLEEQARLGEQELVQGMPVEAMIVTGETTLVEYLFSPIRDSFRRAFRQD